MADALSNNNPAGSPPTEDTFAAPSEQDILSVFDLGDTKSAADSIASGADASPQPGAEGASQTAPAEPPPSPSPAKEPAPAPSPAAAEPAASTPSAEPPAPAPSAEPGSPPAAAKPLDENALRTASLTAQVDALQRELTELRASPRGATPQPSAESGEQQQGDQLLRYNLTLPKPVQDALLSDDPTQNVTAINAIVNDLGTLIHNSVVAQMRKEMSAAIGGLLKDAQGVVSTDERQAAAEGAKADYYKAFPAHDNALVLPIIQSEAQKMAAEFPGLSWGADYINALGARVNNAIDAISGKTPASETPAEGTTPTNAPPAKPAAMLPAGNRSAAAVTASGDMSDEIVGVLSPFGG